MNGSSSMIPDSPIPYICPVCGSEASHIPQDGSLPGSVGAVYRCLDCGLHFHDHTQIPADLYQNAYQGKVQQASMQDYQVRLQVFSSERTDFMVTPALEIAFSWLQQNAKVGTAVLDVGCGRGRQLRRLRRMGFEALGLDLSPQVAEVLAQQGYAVHAGHVETYPDSMPTPDIVMSNNVLHHAEDPVAFLNSILTRFPDAILLLTHGLYPNWTHRMPLVPAGRFGTAYPRHLTGWNPKALGIAFQKAGYQKVELNYAPPAPADVFIPFENFISPLLRRRGRRVKKGQPEEQTSGQKSDSWIQTAAVTMKAMMLAKKVTFLGPAAVARLAGFTPAWVCAAAYPSPGRDNTESTGETSETSAAGDQR
jgi:SAM-dependent methyltransferase